MKLLAVALLVAPAVSGCASGGKSFEEPPDTASTPADAPEVFVDAPVDSAPPVDTAITPPDAAMPDACVATQHEVLVNPALDLAPIGTGWTEVPLPNIPGGPYPLITADGVTAHSAPNKAWLGGESGSDASPIAATVTDQLFQDVTFPADATGFVVTGMFASGGVEDTDQVYDTFTLDVTETNGTPIENVKTANNMVLVGTFTAFSKTLSSNLAGRTVRLRATSTNDVINHTNFFLDTLSFKATFCP